MIEIVQVLNSVGHKLHVITTPHILQQQLLLLKLPHLNLQHQCQQRSQRTGKTFNSVGVLLIGFIVYQISQNFFIKPYSPIGTTPTKSPTPEPYVLFCCCFFLSSLGCTRTYTHFSLLLYRTWTPSWSPTLLPTESPTITPRPSKFQLVVLFADICNHFYLHTTYRFILNLHTQLISQLMIRTIHH